MSRQAKIQAARERFQKRAAAIREEKRLAKPQTPPRYDDVFFAAPEQDTSDLTRSGGEAVVERYRGAGQEVEVRHFNGGVVVKIHPVTATPTASMWWGDQ